MVSAHIEQPEDNIRDFEVGDEEFYGSEGRGVANISSGQKEKRNPKFEGCNQKGAQNSNFGDFEGESSCFELPEFLNRSRSKKKERKYGSLLALQDKALSEVEKRKRDRIKKRLKMKGKENEKSELEGCSITDSDMQARRIALLEEAKKNLAVGKKVGMVIIGDEAEAIEELVSIAEMEQQKRLWCWFNLVRV
ncbi:hypothetical protein GQ457_14G025740 [Hibiscus cannabinus]